MGKLEFPNDYFAFKFCGRVLQEKAGSIWSKASWREGQMCKDCLGVKRPLHWGFYLPLHPGCAATHSFTNGLAVLDVLTHPPFKFEMAPLHSCGKKALRE